MLYKYNMSRAGKHELVFKALADKKRREILDLIKESPRTTGDLCERFKDVDRCTVMQHLGVLEKAGLVIAKKEGRLRWNYINVVPIKEIYDRWISKYASGAVDLLSEMTRQLDK